MVSESTLGLDAAKHSRVHFHKGQVIYGEGEPSNSMYRIERGCVRLQLNGHYGDRQIMAFLFKGDLFGFGLQQRNCSAESVTAVSLIRYSIQSILELTTRSSGISVELINAANDNFANLAHHIEKITHLSAVERVIWFLNWLARQDGMGDDAGLIKLPMCQKDVADYLSVKPETLNRSLKQLENQGHLRREGRRGYTLSAPTEVLRGRPANQPAGSATE